MKKYLWVAAPFVVCGLLTVRFLLLDVDDEARDLGADPSWLASSWALVGLVLTSLILSILLIHDFFEWLNRRAERRLLERTNDR